MQWRRLETFKTRAILNVLNNNLKNIVIRNIKTCSILNTSDNLKPTDINEDLLETDKEYEVLANRCLGHNSYHNCFIIHPFVKWGPRKIRNTNPEKQIQEAIALIRTLAPWKVHGTIAVSLPHLQQKAVLGSGTLKKLKTQIRGNPEITAVFVNIGMLKNIQLRELEIEFGVTIFDRYKIVMQILRLHAISAHAKLQVALAELPYLKMRLSKEDFNLVTSNDYETRKLTLQNREQKLKSAIKKLQSERQVLRDRRKELNFPVIAVVGYTNAGKTSLIKALTGDSKLAPVNHLFATLDVTMHAGKLPSSLEVLFVDTVGFISDIPTTLIECFVVTLEDAMFADLIIHVEDLSSEDLIHQRQHVLSTLQDLVTKTGSPNLLEKIISVGNKYDLVPNTTVDNKDCIVVSATTGQGIDLLRHALDKAVLKATGRTIITFSVPSGGDEMRWLYKNTAVTGVTENIKNSNNQNMTVLITGNRLQQFKHYFIKKK